MNIKPLVTTGWTSYLAVTIALVILMFVTVWGAGASFHSKANELPNGFVLSESPASCTAIQDADKLAYIGRQKTEIAKYGNAHRRTAIEFYGYFYSTYAVFSLFGLWH